MVRAIALVVCAAALGELLAVATFLIAAEILDGRHEVSF